jgi:2-octaprenyl-6-methoxyphenol hydroxylase
VNDQHVDLLIVGGGLTGTLLLLALANQGLRILLVDSHPLSAKISNDFDARTLALSSASVRILQTMQIWPLLQPKATPISTIHVSQQQRFGSATIRSEEEDPLGFVLEMQTLHQVLAQLIDKQQVLAPARLTALDVKQGIATISTDKGEQRIQAKMIVGADGTESTVRKLSGLPVKIKDYHQQALVANIGLARGHQEIAYERFTKTGPIAMLPMTSARSALVWALQPLQAEALLALDDAAFLAALQKAFGYRLGRFTRVGTRKTFPLKQVIMPQKTAWPLVFIGNAAHTLHPVAAQGFNLGLRDVASLAQCILQHGVNKTVLAPYQAMRKHDEQAIGQLADSLVGIFASQLPGMAFARNLGLLAVDNIGILKQCLMHYTRGFAGITPDLVCGITLNQGCQNEAEM